MATLNYKHLQYFLQVAETGSVAAASRQLHLTPQTISGQIQQLGERLGPAPLDTIRQWFDETVWPWPAKPQAYVDQRLLQGRGHPGCVQHAKVVIADPGTAAAQALVTSANFSETAQRHNFEAGWLLRAPWRVDQLHQHFQQLVAEGMVVRLMG